MRWVNHQVVTVASVYAATGNTVAAWLAWAGAILPDAIELPFRGIVKHRSWSHWPYPYMALAAGFWVTGKAIEDPMFAYLGFFFMGGALHLLEDAMSPGGIPWKHPFGPRKGLGIYTPFAKSETYTVAVLIAVSGLIAFLRGALDPMYLKDEVERCFLVLEYLGRRIGGA